MKSLLLLPSPPVPATISTLEAAYGPAIRAVKSDNLELVFPISFKSRLDYFDELCRILSGLYRFAGAVNIAPVEDVKQLQDKEWNAVYSVDGEAGEAVLRTFMDGKRRDVIRVPGGVTLKQRRIDHDWPSSYGLVLVYGNLTGNAGKVLITVALFMLEPDVTDKVVILVDGTGIEEALIRVGNVAKTEVIREWEIAENLKRLVAGRGAVINSSDQVFLVDPDIAVLCVKEPIQDVPEIGYEM